MGADDLAIQGARASAAIILIMLNRINSVPVRSGLNMKYTNYNHLRWFTKFERRSCQKQWSEGPYNGFVQYTYTDIF